MNVLVFKTNVMDIKQVNLISEKIDISLGYRKWDFDLKHPNKIFRVEVLYTTPSEIIDLFKILGYSCEEIILK